MTSDTINNNNKSLQESIFDNLTHEKIEAMFKAIQPILNITESDSDDTIGSALNTYMAEITPFDVVCLLHGYVYAINMAKQLKDFIDIKVRYDYNNYITDSDVRAKVLRELEAYLSDANTDGNTGSSSTNGSASTSIN